MGTRNLTVVVSNGEVKVAKYCQWDGYPSGQGVTALHFLREEMDDSFKSKIDACSWIDEAEHKKMWVDCGADPDSDLVSIEVSEKFKKLYPHLQRDMGADILEEIQDSENGLKLQNSISFAGDSLFCEWGYVIDLDNKTFEVYEGFNKQKLEDTERFVSYKQQDSEYYPIKLKKSYSFDSLPTQEQFLMDLSDNEDDE